MITTRLIAQVLRENQDTWLMCGDIAEQALRLVGQPQFFDVGNPNDVSISQLKQHCSAYQRIIPLYKLSIKNGKSLYSAEDIGSGSAHSSTNLMMFNSKSTCKRLAFDKTIKEYGNENFEEQL